MLRSILALILIAAYVPTALAQSQRRTSRLVHHTLVADLDTARAAREIDTRIRQAGAAKADSIVLELRGDSWRTDVVHDVPASLRASPVRTVVWLRDTTDHTVSRGHAALGLVAAECWIDPRTRIVSAEGDDRRDLAPRGTNHDKLADELMRWAAENRAARGFDPLLPRLFLGPPAPMWGVRDADAMRIVPADPGDAAGARSLARTVNGTRVIDLDADTAVGLRLAAGSGERLADLFAHRHVNPSTGGALLIQANLDRILARAADDLDSLDRELESIETQLGAKPRDRRVNTRDFYRDLGARVLKHAAAARERLNACEKLLADDPEIARTSPPGSSAIDADPDDNPALWRKTFQKRRDQIARLEKKARGYAGR